MKLAGLLVVLLITGLGGLGGVARANPVDPYAPQPQPQVQKQRGMLKQLLLQRFDRNGDGRLQPQERKQAAKVLRKLAQRLERGDGRPQGAPSAQGPLAPRFAHTRGDRTGLGRQHRRQRFFQRFDHNRDGNVGPGELPPGLADELRPLDRDGDGWLHGDEVP